MLFTMRFMTFAVFVFALSAAAEPTKLQPDEQVNVSTYQKCNPAVVNITAVTLRRDFFFDIVPQKGQGSGVIYKPEGIVVTNDHVVGNAQKVEVTLSDKKSYPARVIGTDPDTDLAVLKIESKEKLPSLDWGASGDLKVGQKVLAIGNPFGLGGSLSVGVISSLGRDIRGTNDRLIKDVIQTDAAINPGNSGGPLLDSSGKLIGLNTQIVSASGGSDGIGFAISVDTVKRVVDQLIQFGRVLRPDLGLEGIGFPPALFQSLQIPLENGVMITDMDPRGLAARAGLKPADRELIYGFRRIPVGGDVIHQIDSTKVSTLRDILDALVDKKVGDEITIHYLRGQQKKTAKIKLTTNLPASRKGKSL